MYCKYPRTYHLPWSLGRSSDDKVLKNTDHFVGHEVIVSEKMDGENTTMYSDYIHARSLDSAHHVSRDWVKRFHGSIRHLIPKNMRICGENLYARHSVEYQNLKSYFYGFSIFEDDICLSWDDTLFYFDEIGITSVNQIYRGIFDQDLIQNIILDLNKVEGYVVRKTCSFHYNDFSTNVAKFVRENHIQSSEHWMHQIVVPNQLLVT